ncbi:hypothetical protein AZSI13_16060 [Azospira sp. I13]|uniref:hypothetical protein n=1 Tax=Azospira sp. I13 TaxID=1765050 RepID=UPI000D45AA60|nr:hypothetical protein [Azospira sp. I13]GBG02279.1 hypothetical protein AZSI13_16060 [Azospira sp. I13]
MQKFSKKQIALAISASLLAGSALAAAPASRTAAPVLVTSVGGATEALYATTGLVNQTVTFKYYIVDTDVADTLASAGPSVINNATPANNTVNVYAVDAAAAKTYLTVTSATFTSGGAGGLGDFSVVLTAPGANKGFKVIGGKLKYSADTTVAAPVWQDVKFEYNDLAGSAVNDGVAASKLVSLAATDIQTSLVPALKSVKTRATNGLVDGITFETYTPLSAFANDDVDVATIIKTAGSITTKAGALTTGYTAQAKAATTNTYEVFFAAPATIDWTAGDTTADAAAYSSDLFNTGVAGGGLAFSVAATATGANQTDYSEVFDAVTGAKAKFSAGLAASASTDGAAPVLKTAVYSAPAGTLTLTVSEPVSLGGIAGGADQIRKVLENVSVAGVKLAADYQLRSASANVTTGTDGHGYGTVLLSNIGTNRTDVEGKTVAVLPTIALKDAFSNNDTATLDVSYLASNSGAVEGSSGSVTATAVNTVAWADSVARAYYSVTPAEAGLVKTIEVDFGKALSLKTGGSLDKTFEIKFWTPNQLENGGGFQFTWYPAAGEYAISGNKIVFTIPTALLRTNLKGIGDAGTVTSVRYVGSTATVASPLQAAVGATTVAVADGIENVIMPLSATAVGQGLYTMDVKADLKAPAGSKVIAYLAKWVEKATADAAQTSISAGKVSIPGDKWATDVALALDGSVGALESKIDDQLASAKPAAVQAWVVVTRSNDLVKGGSNTGNSTGAGSENYLVASATLYGNANAATSALSGDHVATAFEVALDPKTGKISGRLTGDVKLANGASNVNERGLVFIKSDGTLTNSAATAAQSQALVDAAGKARFLIGAGPEKDLKDAGAVFKDAFVLLVSESQDAAGASQYKLLTSAEPSMSNFLPFNANLVAGNDALGTVTLDVANIKTASLANDTAWQLVGAGNLDRSAKAAAAISLPRLLVGLNGSTPKSFWTNDGTGNVTDIALTLLGNKSGVAVEAADKDVNTVASGSNTKANAFAFAFANDVAAANNKLFFLTKTAEAPALPVGWALVAANATSLPSDVSMALFAGSNHVGIGSSWATGDTAATLTVGQPLFVYAKKAIAGK